MKYFLSFIITFSLVSSIAFAEDVCLKSSNKSALVVIDMQSYFVTRGGHDQEPENKKKTEKVIQEQIQAIREAKSLGLPIVFIEYEYDDIGETSPQLKNEVRNYSNIKFIEIHDSLLSGEDLVFWF